MKTVDQVLSQFTKVINDLDQVREQQLKRSMQVYQLTSYVNRVQDYLMAIVTKASREAVKASKQRDRLHKLLIDQD